MNVEARKRARSEAIFAAQRVSPWNFVASIGEPPSPAT
ncbi:hypothetical protein AKJ09_06039 [Labilithrix luteola]|uniref:Uncharacterized protein n=1 Tax=Labilithrix luteola TaxID=1391654 RepID=A0A0K1Q0R3_9BACT|nr:hypothetical protein AKJ09_06039 [Labilithrix luteola]